jgi:hypothetical protein
MTFPEQLKTARDTMTTNTTATKYKVGQFVKPNGYSKNAKRGKIIGFAQPVGTAGEWSYDVLWFGVGSGNGWRDCDLAPCL